MKKAFVLFAACALFAACSGNSSSSSADSTATDSMTTDSTMTGMSDTDSASAARHAAKAQETNVDTNRTKIGTDPQPDSTK